MAKQVSKMKCTLATALQVQLVTIKWHDAFILHGWQKEIDDFPAVSFTAGFLLKKTKLHYVVASSLGQTFGTASDVTYIPIKMVQEIKYHGKVFKFNQGKRST